MEVSLVSAFALLPRILFSFKYATTALRHITFSALHCRCHRCATVIPSSCPSEPAISSNFSYYFCGAKDWAVDSRQKNAKDFDRAYPGLKLFWWG
jgi:hypothetical protein